MNSRKVWCKLKPQKNSSSHHNAVEWNRTKTSRRDPTSSAPNTRSRRNGAQLLHDLNCLDNQSYVRRSSVNAQKRMHEKDSHSVARLRCRCDTCTWHQTEPWCCLAPYTTMKRGDCTQRHEICNNMRHAKQSHIRLRTALTWIYVSLHWLHQAAVWLKVRRGMPSPKHQAWDALSSSGSGEEGSAPLLRSKQKNYLRDFGSWEHSWPSKKPAYINVTCEAHPFQSLHHAAVCLVQAWLKVFLINERNDPESTIDGPGTKLQPGNWRNSIQLLKVTNTKLQNRAANQSESSGRGKTPLWCTHMPKI